MQIKTSNATIEFSRMTIRCSSSNGKCKAEEFALVVEFPLTGRNGTLTRYPAGWLVDAEGNPTCPACVPIPDSISVGDLPAYKMFG